MKKLLCSVAVLVVVGSQAVRAQDVVQAPYGPDGTWVIYELGDDLLTWAEALEDAQSRTREGVQGDLASIHNLKENQVVADLAFNQIVWIGLTDREGAAPQLDQNGYLSPQESIQLDLEEFIGAPDNVDAAKFPGWAWTSGETFTFHNWAGGEPNNWDGTAAGPADFGFEDATFIRADGLWNDAPSGYPEDEPVVATLQPGTSTEEQIGLPNIREYDYVIEYRTNSPTPIPGIDEVGEELDPDDLLPEPIDIGPPPPPALQPGDADQNFSFDQLDIVKVSIANKYLSGQPATWGEGDWDGAPGGSQGDPPAGNGFFDQLDVIAALSAGKYLTGPYAALAPNGTLDDEQTTLVYDAATGELSVDAPATTELTSIFVTSAGNLFVGDKPPVLDGPFDSFGPDNIFKSTIGGSFGDSSFGNVLPAGLSETTVVADLSASGSLDGGGGLGDVDLVYVPEPTSALLLACGVMLGLICHRRKTQSCPNVFSFSQSS